MIKALKILGVTISVIILILLVAGYYFFSGFPDICANTIITSSTSPNNKWKVVLFERNCGTTTSFSSQISLLKSDEELNNEGGNIYIAKGYPKNYSIKWKSDTLVIIKGANSNNKRKLPQLNGVKFIYE